MRYPGGKGKCYQHIINILPPHRVYIETHLGGGAVLRRKKGAATSIGIDIDATVIGWWKRMFPKLATYVEADAVEFLSTRQYRGDEVIYCDPPYLPTTRRKNPVYRYDYSEADHIRLLSTLQTLPCLIVVSGYPSELYDDFLRGWTTRKFTAASHYGARQEQLWFNFEPPNSLHDDRYLGHNFRERQTIKRRLERLRKRIDALPPQQQSALLDALNALRQPGGTHLGSAREPGLTIEMPAQLPLFPRGGGQPNPGIAPAAVAKKGFQRASSASELTGRSQHVDHEVA